MDQRHLDSGLAQGDISTLLHVKTGYKSIMIILIKGMLSRFWKKENFWGIFKHIFNML